MKAHKRIHTPLAVPPATDTAEDERLLRIRERPDGYHWIDEEGRQEFGPFESLEDALADMDGPVGEPIEESEAVELAEQGLAMEQVDRGGQDEPEAAT
jgi:hypothetical protein